MLLVRALLWIVTGTQDAAAPAPPAPPAAPAAQENTKSKVTEPRDTKQDSAKPADGKPADATPAATKPAATKPAATKPAATKPAAKKTEATKDASRDATKTDPSKPKSTSTRKKPAAAAANATSGDGNPAAKPSSSSKKTKRPKVTVGDGKPGGDAATSGAPDGAPRKPVVVPTPRPRAPEIPSYKVSIRMKNGRRFGGVVSRDKAFHEVVHAGSHHQEDVYKLPVRFMLRFVDGLDGDLELCWNQVGKLEVRDILDSAGVRAMEQAYATMRVAREERVDATPPAADATDGAEPPPEGEAPVGDGEPQGDKPGEIPLLVEFSPRAGWSPDRKKQIEWRRTVVGSFPDAREQRFLDVYDEWLPLYEAWQKEEAQPPGEEKPRTDTGDRPAEPAPPARPADESPPPPPQDGGDGSGDPSPEEGAGGSTPEGPPDS